MPVLYYVIALVRDPHCNERFITAVPNNAVEYSNGHGVGKSAVGQVFKTLMPGLVILCRLLGMLLSLFVCTPHASVSHLYIYI